MANEEVFAIARQYLRNVKRSGPDNVMATCPFHSMGERVTTTFALSLSKGLYFCFSCKERGNLPKFLNRMGMSKGIIGEQYGFLIDELLKYSPKPLDPLAPNVIDAEPLPEALLGLFDKCPLELLEDGFSEETLRVHDVGFDDAHMRITFPIRDLSGQLVGISGKAVGDDYPKYKVYRTEYKDFGLVEHETKKERYLWNAHQVYPEVFFKPGASIILVEGFKACMWVIQAGMRNTVALMGSYMSDRQKWILEHLGATVYIMLDNDPAGRKGTEFIGKELAKTLDVKVVDYETLQPDGLSQYEVLDAIANARDYYLWAINKKEQNQWPSEKTAAD